MASGGLDALSFNDRDQHLRIIPRQPIDGLWRGDEVNLMLRNGTSTCEMQIRRLISTCTKHFHSSCNCPIRQLTGHRPRVIRDNIKMHFCHGQPRFESTSTDHLL
ncbi:hypothetical protein AVEN_33940-1 [Araneus ventricosus]|uniref:Uncharacterized protein n=1 Tax=Araneus ventricosus TaxID=182803 RepID=A0A4Y2K049_ARAVE|nr:hypothetical protein AVEN_33940-1 [Araneus ventricosus]